MSAVEGTEGVAGISLADRPGTRSPLDPPLPGELPAWQRRLWAAVRSAPVLAVVAAVLGALLSAALVGAAELRGPTTYTASATMFIDDPYALATAGDSGQLLKLDTLRVKYASLVGTDVIAGPVAARLGLPVGAVLGAVSASVPGESLLMDVSASWSSPRLAVVLADDAAAQVTAYVRQEESAFGIPADDRFTLTDIQPAVSAEAHAPSRARAVTDEVAVALAALVVIYLGVQLIRNRRLLLG
jgi:hypothetical protein